MTGLKTLACWVLATAVIALIACIGPVLKWTELHTGLAAWFQAVFSVAAIAGAVWVGDRQHTRDVKREARKVLRERVDRYNAVLQLMTAVEQIAKKMKQHCAGEVVQAPRSGPAGGAGEPTALGFDIICLELETALNAVARVDYLVLAEYKLILGLQVAESSGRTLLKFSKTQLDFGGGGIRWEEAGQYADLCERTIKPLADDLHETKQALAREVC